LTGRHAFGDGQAKEQRKQVDRVGTTNKMGKERGGLARYGNIESNTTANSVKGRLKRDNYAKRKSSVRTEGVRAKGEDVQNTYTLARSRTKRGGGKNSSDGPIPGGNALLEKRGLFN